MHESSLVRSLLDQVQALTPSAPGTRVDEICVELGPLSGVEPLLIQSAFEQLAPSHNIAARLTIQQVPLEALCLTCQTLTEVQSFVFRCTHCGSDKLRIMRGDEFRLLSITVNEPDSIDEAT